MIFPGVAGASSAGASSATSRQARNTGAMLYRSGTIYSPLLSV